MLLGILSDYYCLLGVVCVCVCVFALVCLYYSSVCVCVFISMGAEYTLTKVVASN